MQQACEVLAYITKPCRLGLSASSALMMYPWILRRLAACRLKACNAHAICNTSEQDQRKRVSSLHEGKSCCDAFTATLV